MLLYYVAKHETQLLLPFTEMKCCEQFCQNAQNTLRYNMVSSTVLLCQNKQLYRPDPESSMEHNILVYATYMLDVYNVSSLS